MSLIREVGRNVRWEIIPLLEDKEVQKLAQRLMLQLRAGSVHLEGVGDIIIRRTGKSCLVEFCTQSGEILLTQSSTEKLEIMIRFQNEKKKWLKYLKALDSAEL